MQSHSSSHKVKVKHNPRNPTKALQNLQHGAGFNFDPIGSGYRKNRDKGKGKAGTDDEDEDDDDGAEGRFSLLALPHTLIPQILSLIPPRSLLPLRLISSHFANVLDEDSVWRESYVNRFFCSWAGQHGSSDQAKSSDIPAGTSTVGDRKEEMAKGLVRSCVGDDSGGGGWKKEALSRESMLDRFLYSKAPTVVHNPHIDTITSLSLFYTPPQPHPMPTRYGRTPSTPSKLLSATPARDTNATAGPSTPNPTTTKLIGAKHRQPHRSPGNDPTGFGGTGGMGRAPNTICVGMNAGVAVRGDPLVGKSLQGWLGPGQISTLGHVAPVPQCSYTPTRNPGFTLWGLRSGHVTLSILLNPLPHPGRLSGPIVACLDNDAHLLPVRCVWASTIARNASTEQQRYLSGADDGRVKIWKHEQPSKRNGHGPGTAGSLVCIYTSPILSHISLPVSSYPSTPARPLNRISDSVICLRSERETNFVVAATESGAIWLLTDVVTGGTGEECRVHCLLRGPPNEYKVSALSLHSKAEAGADDGARILDVCLHEEGRPTIDKLVFRISSTGSPVLIGLTMLGVPGNSTGICSVYVDLDSHPSISLPTSLVRGDFSVGVPGTEGTEALARPLEQPRTTVPLSQGIDLGVTPYVIAGYADGTAHIWDWDTSARQIGPKETDMLVCPVRSWAASEDAAITTVTSSCSLVATGDAHGNIHVWDALERNPILLKTLRNRHATTPTAYPALHTAESLMHSVNAIILEADMVVAAVGSHIIGWRAGNRKSKDGKDGWKGQVLGKHSNGKTSPAKGYDAKHLKTVVAESKSEIKAEQEEIREQHQREALIRCEMDNIGLEDPDEALQYALLLSKDETSRRGSAVDRMLEEAEDPGLQEALEAIRLAEAAERDATRSTSTSATSSTPVSYTSESGNSQDETGIQLTGRTSVPVRYSELTEEQELAVALQQIKLAEEAEARGRR